MPDDEENYVDHALRAIGRVRGLLQQQEYELQRIMAEIQLAAIEIESALSACKVPWDVASKLDDLHSNVKYCLRNGRSEVNEAERYVAEARDQVWGLEAKDEYR